MSSDRSSSGAAHEVSAACSSAAPPAALPSHRIGILEAAAITGWSRQKLLAHCNAGRLAHERPDFSSLSIHFNRNEVLQYVADFEAAHDPRR